jgi:hypothetical protein
VPVLLLNDTEDVYHWGCYGTSRAIKDQLSKKGVTEIDSVSVTQTHLLPDVPKRVADFADRRWFCSTYPGLSDRLSRCDAVVINGEGTIHGCKSAPRALLYLAYASKHFFGKRVFLINHSCYPKSRRSGVIDYYRAAYSSCDYVAAREGRSTRIIEHMLGVKCVKAFDSLPLAIQSVHDHIPPPLVTPPYICLSGAVNYRIELSPIIARRLHDLFPRLTCVYLVGSKGEGANSEEARVYESLKADMPDLHWFQATSFHDWLSVIKHSSFLLSGRFHYTIAALCLGTPAICFRSNTPKISSVLEDLHLPGVIPRSPRFLFSSALGYRLRRIEKTPHPSLLEYCCSLAQRNFDWEL